MWPFSSHRSDSLKSRLILSAVLPGLMATLLLTGLLGWSSAHLQERQQQEQWRSSLGLLIAQAETTLRDDDTSTLGRLAQQALALPDIRSIIFRDALGRELIRAGAPLHTLAPPPGAQVPQAQVFNHDSRVQHLWPIRAKSSNDLLGWVEVEFSSDALKLLLYRNLAILALVLSIVTCLALVLASYLFRRTTSGFRLMQRELERVRHGDFQTHISASDSDEMNHLIDTLNETFATFAHHQRELQEHINQSTQDLRETLETIEIQNIELDLARKEALNASKIKSEFLANTSHEIRTPLNGIIGFTRLLLKDCRDSQQREYLTTILHSSENLLNLINDILDLSKIEAGKLVLDYESFDIRELAEETLQILAPSAHEKGLELTLMVDSALPHHFFGDAARLKQILTNLIGNAIKFSNTGSILVRIDPENNDGHSALVKCSVSDTGIGIRRSELNKDLFSAFSQAGSTPQQRSGAGLGLAISKKLVDQMSGDIGMNSEENIGSKFWFTVRLDVDQQRSAPVPRADLQGRPILLFDTNAASRQSLMSLLTECGAQLSVTQGIADILPALTNNSQSPPDQWLAAVLIGIPVDAQHFPMDRLGELVEQARRFCPVIVATSTTLRHYLENHLPSDTRYINKPVTQRKLLRALAAGGIVSAEGSRNPPEDLAPREAVTATGQLLVVDDQPANLKLLSRLLGDLGYSVKEANSGREALALCEETLFDGVFMDIRMPGMDGVETTRRIRQLDNPNRSTPVIAVTAHAMSDQKRQLLLAGMDDYLSKPLQEQALRQILQRWLPCTVNVPHTSSSLEEMTSIDKCVDVGQCLSLSHGKASLAADMLAMLLADLPTLRHEINEALSRQRYADARELVHKLHGACCYCGVPDLRDACKILEQHLAHYCSAPDDRDRECFNAAVDALLLWQEHHEIHELFI